MIVNLLLGVGLVAGIALVVYCWPRAGLPPVSQRCLAKYREDEPR